MRAKKTDSSMPHCTPMPSTKTSTRKSNVSATMTGNPPISSANSRTSRVLLGWELQLMLCGWLFKKRDGRLNIEWPQKQ